MSLLEEQVIFSKDITYLMLYAQSLGYFISCGDFFRDDRCNYGHKNSLHKLKLAADLNLFRRNAKGKLVYLKKTKDHKVLGEYWEAMDPLNSWGGHFNDGNHYSRKYRGMK